MRLLPLADSLLSYSVLILVVRLLQLCQQGLDGVVARPAWHMTGALRLLVGVRLLVVRWLDHRLLLMLLASWLCRLLLLLLRWLLGLLRLLRNARLDTTQLHRT